MGGVNLVWITFYSKEQIELDELYYNPHDSMGEDEIDTIYNRHVIIVNTFM